MAESNAKLALRRSCLSVPATQSRFHVRAEESAADQIMFDLEDSVAPTEKAIAREAAVGALRARDYSGKLRSVRINGCDTAWCHEDITAVIEGAGDRVDSIVVPKVDGVEHVHFVDVLLRQLEKRYRLGHRVGLELQIESARGMENVGGIASASSRTITLIFGPADFSASMQAPELTVGSLRAEYPGDYWHYFLARVAVAARANGLQPIDGPYAELDDLDGLRVLARRAAMLGYAGKWALHPKQIGVLNDVFVPSQEEFDRASAILESYRQAASVDQLGAVMFGNVMIDEASRRLAQTMVDRGLALGMTAKPWTGRSMK
jgi:citrate lyase subunit beta/citryl-CoA lyase